MPLRVPASEHLLQRGAADREPTFSIVGSANFNGALPVYVAFGFCDPSPNPLPTLATCPFSPTSLPHPICPAGPGGCFSYIEGIPLAMVPEMC